MCPLRGAALRAAGCDRAGADVREQLGRRRGERRLRPGTSDVDARVVVGAADAGAVERRDVCRGRSVQLTGARAVAHLPDVEQLRQAAAVARSQRRADVVVGVGQRAGDLTLVHVGGAQLDVVAVRLQPLVIVRRDAEAEHVHGLRLAAKGGGQLLGDEHVGAVGDLEHAVDRVVVGDRDEVHPAALGQLVDLLRRRRALRQSGRALHSELGLLRRGRVAMKVRSAYLRKPRRSHSLTVHSRQIPLQSERLL